MRRSTTKSTSRVSRARHSRAEIAEILGDYSSSGLTQVDFAASRAVPVSTFTNWLRRWRREQATAALASEPAQLESFVEVVAAVDTVAAGDGYDFEVTFENPTARNARTDGHRAGPTVSSLRIRAGFDATDLSRALEALGVPGAGGRDHHNDTSK